MREHLARCEACRRERDARAGDRALLREDLAALSPSPFLEDEIVRLVRTFRPTATRTIRRPIAVFAAAIAAVVAVAAFAFTPWLRPAGEEPHPSGEAENAARISAAPSAERVRRARAENRVALPETETIPAMLHAGPGERAQASPVFLPPWDDVAHRWVYGDREGRPGPRTYAMGMPAEEGVMLLGNDVMKHFGAPEISFTGRDRALVVRVGDRRWEALPGTSRAELTIGSPEKGGTEARIRVAVSTAYSGGILLEGPIARALGLNQFEIPGGFRIESTEWRGHRARARVRIPELDFDRVVEVQVSDEPPAAPGAEPRRVTISGLAPGSATVDLGELDRAGSDFAVDDYRTAIEASSNRVTLVDRFEPGAVATIARVWRGHEAIPSREAVIRTRVAPDGTLAFPRLPGERGTTLRMHLLHPNGTDEFRDVRVETPSGEGPVSVTREEDVVLVRFTGNPNEITDPDEILAALSSLQTSLQGIADRSGREADGTSVLRLRVSVPATTRWQWVQWVLQTAAHPKIRMDRFTFAPETGGKEHSYELPKDTGLSPGFGEETPRVKIKLFRTPPPGPDETRIRIGNSAPAVLLREGPGRAQALEDLRTILSGALATRATSSVEVDAKPPTGPQVPFSDVHAVLQVVQSLGISDVVFEGSPLPR